MPSRFEGKVAVVTGAANGFGEAVAERLVTDGASVVLVDVNDKVQEVASRLGGVGVVADVTRPEDVARYVREADAAFGRIDLFFNNAGIEGARGSFGDLSIEDFDRVLNVNVRGVWLGLHEVMPVMERSGGGAIVNTSSMAGIKGGRNFSPYITSKHAVVGITKCAAQEGAPNNIRCNAICPGLIDTEMLRRLGTNEQGDYAANLERMAGTVPLGRLGTAEEVANFATWLLSDEASYISGGVFLIDGALNA
jgi:NAD(P)-dependent dehydrogenase (short-subunit alcohol dehydrogenase family)